MTDEQYVREAIPRIRAIASVSPAHRGWKDIEDAVLLLRGRPGKLFSDLASIAAYFRAVYPEET